MLKKLSKNKFFYPVVCLLVGMAIGAIFYPSKSITREEIRKYEAKIEKLEEQKRFIELDRKENWDFQERKFKRYQKETEQKISTLRTENTQLKQKVKERIVKIVTPDGTIREEIVRESDTQVVSQIVTDIKQEFTEKVASIENRWKTVHERRVVQIKDSYEKKLAEKQHIIDTYSKKETIKINERKFGVSLGYTTDDTIYSNISYSIFGPFFVDFNVTSDREFKDQSLGAGIGISF